MIDGDVAAHQGLRVLALPVSALPLRPLIEGKARLNWHVDLIFRGNEEKAFSELVAPSGSAFRVPGTDHQAWEDDPREIARVDGLIRAAERATGVPVAQVVLASGASVGISFAASIVHLMIDPSLPNLPAGADNQEPIRIIRRAFHFSDRVLETARPDMIYCFELASLWSFVVWLLAKSRGIPCVAVRRSKIRSDHCFVTTDRQMFNIAARELAHAKRDAKADVSEAARHYIKEFRDQPKMVSYIRTKWDRRQAQSKWWNWHRMWARSTASDVLRTITGRRKTGGSRYAGRDLVQFNRRFYKSIRHQRFLKTFADDELTRLNYILFPIHKETDLSVYYQAAPWFDQRSTIRLLASTLPHGYRLLLREHRDNYGLRPDNYYRELLSLPNVDIVDPFDSQFKYIANADLLVTENGSSGWEALLLGRKVITLSSTFYDGAGLARSVEQPKDLGGAIIELLSCPSVAEPGENDLDLGRMIDAEHETSFPLRDADAALKHIVAQISRIRAG